MSVTTNTTALPPGSFVYTSSSTAINAGSVMGAKRAHNKHTDVDMSDLNSDVFKAKIETLVDIWVTRYSNEWVDLSDVMDDEFYGRVYKRLKSLGELEVHFLTDRAKYVCRKPE